MTSNCLTSRRLSAPTAASTPNCRRSHPASMSSRRSWLNSTEPIPRRRAHLAAWVRVHLSDTSMDVGRNRSRTLSARHGVAIMRYCLEIFGAAT